MATAKWRLTINFLNKHGIPDTMYEVIDATGVADATGILLRTLYGTSQLVRELEITVTDVHLEIL